MRSMGWMSAEEHEIGVLLVGVGVVLMQVHDEYTVPENQAV